MLSERLVLVSADPAAAHSVDSAGLIRRRVVLPVCCCYGLVADLICDVGLVFDLASRVTEMHLQLLEGMFVEGLDLKIVLAPGQKKFG